MLLPNSLRHRRLYEYVEVNSLDYWVNERNYSTAIIADAERIEKINEMINDKMIKCCKDKSVSRELATYNLLDYETSVTKETIVEMVKFTADKFFQSIPDENYYNLDSLLEKNEISYAIVTEKTDIRIIPTRLRIFCEPKIDKAQGTSIKFGEPLVVLHRTADNEWSFVRTYNVEGWIRTEKIAFTTRDKFANYINMSNFLVIISKKEFIKDNYLDMGVKLELKNENEKSYAVNFPARDRKGLLFYQEIDVEKNSGLHRGYLDYSEKNIVAQAMKYYGTPYEWGSTNDGVDCSGLILNVYSVFGFKLPRNSSKQQIMGKDNYRFTGSSRAPKFLASLINRQIYKKNRVLDHDAKAGSILFFPGHVMLYLGKVANKHYVVHSLFKYKKSIGRGKYTEDCPQHVIVSAMEDLRRMNESSFMDSLFSVTTIE
jgi:hypothetical protein